LVTLSNLSAAQKSVNHLKILGLDLAGKIKNPTGVCFLHSDSIHFETVHSDFQILEIVSELKPDIIAIDAPLIKGEPRVRNADKLLKKYGVLYPTLPTMKPLTLRGSRLSAKLASCYRMIEVFPTATSKILGVFHKNYKETASRLNIVVKNKHELDAYLCCLTAKLFLEEKTIAIGDKEEIIIIPENKN
jgi:predicted nuclease with RNAse H fold